MFGAPIGLQSWEWLPLGAQRGGPAAASVSRGIKKKSRRGVGTSKLSGSTERRIEYSARIANPNSNGEVFGYRSEDCVALLHKGHTRQPANRHMRDVIAPRDRGQRLALSHPRQSFRLLMLRELGLPSEPNTASLGTDPPFIGSAKDQMTLELCQPTK